MYHLYILRSESTGRYYVGQTIDLGARLAYHNANYSESLKNRRPWRAPTEPQPPARKFPEQDAEYSEE